MKCTKKGEIRREMEGVLDNMCRDQKLVSRYYNREEEGRRIHEGICKEIAEKTALRTKKEIIINMYNQNATIELMSSVPSSLYASIISAVFPIIPVLSSVIFFVNISGITSLSPGAIAKSCKLFVLNVEPV